MICKIADLLVEVPATGDLVSRCREYVYADGDGADICIRTELYCRDLYPKSVSEETLIYLESGRQFCAHLLKYDGFHLHASAVEIDGKAYLFSANSGGGKSTHSKMWRQVLGERVNIINDDKPALRCIDDVWYVYGTPWCGKDGININKKVPLAGICFLKQAHKNQIRQLTRVESVQRIVRRTIYRFRERDNLELMLSHVDKLLRQIPIFELENRPEPEAARLSYETMRRKAEELGL